MKYETMIWSGCSMTMGSGMVEDNHDTVECGFATNIIKKEFSLSDVVTIQLENGSEVTVTKDYPIVGAGKSAGWQVFDIDVFIKKYLDTTYTTSEENRNKLIYHS